MGKFLADQDKNGIRFALVEVHGMNIFIIRGTRVDNWKNLCSDAEIFFDGGRVNDTIEDTVHEVFTHFQETYGNIRVATGHSLGGRLVEIAVQHEGVLGITFNSFLSNMDDAIIHFRTVFDVAAVHKGHTDHRLSAGVLSDNPIQAHSIAWVIRCLKKAGNYWDGGDLAKARAMSCRQPIHDDVLIRCNVRTMAEVKSMSTADKRNTLIAELAQNTRLTMMRLGTESNDDLVDHTILYHTLLTHDIRSADSLRNMLEHDMRNTLIVELHQKTAMSEDDLQAQKTRYLCDIQVMYQLLLTLDIRSAASLRTMLDNHMRNTLIVELHQKTAMSEDGLQAQKTSYLCDIQVMYQLLLTRDIRSAASLRTMLDNHMRNTLIVALESETRISTDEWQHWSSGSLCHYYAGEVPACRAELAMT